MSKLIYHFNASRVDGNANMVDLLGGKGASLAEMFNLGLPVPEGFTISTELCKYYYENNLSLPPDFDNFLNEALNILEQATNKKLGNQDNPLFLSIRSGAKYSMPGMMDTILNIGINQTTNQFFIRNNKEYLGLDLTSRLYEMYGSTIYDIPKYIFESTLDRFREANNLLQNNNVLLSDKSNLLEIIKLFEELILKHSGNIIPKDPRQQLKEAIIAVLNSWMSPRAKTYRKINSIADFPGTAINVQSMVFGNMNDQSATGVIFTRNPATAEKKVFGEYLVNAQGEDIVAGIKTPKLITEEVTDLPTQALNDLFRYCQILENHYKDVQDIEFTIENGKLYILQTRSAKRTISASIKIAIDMISENLISKQEAIMRVDPDLLTKLLHSSIDYNHPAAAKKAPLCKGLPASPGAATGIIVFSPYEAEEAAIHHSVILVRSDTSPDDIQGMHVAAGILTAKGGMTSHAAVVARGMGKPCVCGVNELVVNEQEGYLKIGNSIIKKGDNITIDGSTGKVFLGDMPLMQNNYLPELQELLKYADEFSKLKVRANAETSVDLEVALKFGACGVGLCRTEHMFFEKQRMGLIQELITAPSFEHREQVIEKLLPLHIEDFKKLFSILKSKPINIRLLDPPLHEFLPTSNEDIATLAKSLMLSRNIIDQRLLALQESNPMMGHRGCRLGITHPEIYAMQVRAIFTAIYRVWRDEAILTNLELMIPLIAAESELITLKSQILSIVSELEHEFNFIFKYQLGTMIELPRAAMIADKLANKVDYFSFGTNDLTQTTYGLSRDDIATFMPEYIEKGIFKTDPFQIIDPEGVGQLINQAITKALPTNPDLKIGVCGEHGGNPTSINFFHENSFHYVSCSPYRVPIARLAAARAAISNQKI